MVPSGFSRVSVYVEVPVKLEILPSSKTVSPMP